MPIGKNLRNISIKELHNGLMAKPPFILEDALDLKGNCLISDTSLNSLMPPNVKKCRTSTK